MAENGPAKARSSKSESSFLSVSEEDQPSSRALQGALGFNRFSSHPKPPPTATAKEYVISLKGSAQIVKLQNAYVQQASESLVLLPCFLLFALLSPSRQRRSRFSNAIYERNVVDLLFECIPMLIFMVCFFAFTNYIHFWIYLYIHLRLLGSFLIDRTCFFIVISFLYSRHLLSAPSQFPCYWVNHALSHFFILFFLCL